MKRNLILAAIFLSALLTVAFIYEFKQTILIVQAIGTPDAYGNVIMWLCIYQYNGTDWNLLQNVTTAANWTQRVVEAQPINITVRWRLNNTLASSEAEAISYTRVLMNLTNGGTIWNNAELNNTASASDANYYYGTELAYWNHSGLPASGVVYYVATRYEAYY